MGFGAAVRLWNIFHNPRIRAVAAVSAGVDPSGLVELSFRQDDGRLGHVGDDRGVHDAREERDGE